MDNTNLYNQVIQNYNSKASIISKYRGTLSDNSIIIVSQNEDAIIVKQKQIQCVLKSGKYCFSEFNFPKVLGEKFQKDVKVDLYELFFINKIQKITVDWGTNHPLQIQEQNTKIFLSVVAYGQFHLFVDDSEIIFNQIYEYPDLIGDDEALKDYLFNQFINYICNLLINTITQKQDDILSISSDTVNLSKQIEKNISNVFSQYGFELDCFTILNLQVQQNKQFELLQRTIQKNEQLSKLCQNSCSSPSTIVVGDFSNCDQIQIGSSNSQQSIGLNTEEINSMIQLILDNLSIMQLENFKEDNILHEIQKINDELNKKRPKREIILKAFGSIKSILEGIAGSFVASSLISKLELFK
ncbi:hypothetical protein D3Z36_02290 [Lachnospiraceae bacterium]|nr:hypothetical protein [Lachnospiraceae bacterium]